MDANKLNKEQVERYIQDAYAKGVPRDQLENFLGRGYVPLSWQCVFHVLARQADKKGEFTMLGAGGARGPGKSHAVFAQATLDDCQRVKNLKGLFLRQTGKSARESFEDLIDRVLTGRISYKYNPSNGILKFPNRSRILLGGFETEKDIDKYIGIQYDFIAIEELNQLTEEKVIKLLGSMRTSKSNWRPRFYSSFNPGGIGHAFVKKWFIDPWRIGEKGKTRFVPSTYKDNPYLNIEYVEYLEGLQGKLGKAWREGNWDIFEGQFFTEWDYNIHTIEPFAIPEGWKRYRSYDHGRDKPACCKWYANDYDGRIWVYREFYQAGLNVDQIGLEINRLSKGERYEYSVADPSIFASHGFVDRSGGQTIAESFLRQGIMWVPGSDRRVDGWNLVHQYLHWDKAKEKKPKIVFFKTCLDSIRTYPLQIHNEYRPEDLDTNGEDHAQDCDRYMLVSLHERASALPLTAVEKKLKKLKESAFNLNEYYYGS